MFSSHAAVDLVLGRRAFGHGWSPSDMSKGVVLWIAPDRHPLAGATNTNEAALIYARLRVSTAPFLWSRQSLEAEGIPVGFDM